MENIFKGLIGIGVSLIATASSIFVPKNLENTEWNQFVTSYQYINEIGPIVIESIKRKDKDRLNELFCDKVNNTEYLNNSINEFFKYIDDNGGIVIEDNAQWTVPSEHKTFSDKGSGKVVHFTSSLYWGIVLINNEKYELYVSSYLVLSKYKEYEKICEIYLLKDTEEKLSINDKNKIADNNHSGSFLGMGIHILNLDKLCWENVILPKVENIDEYHYSFNELEKGASNW